MRGAGLRGNSSGPRRGPIHTPRIRATEHPELRRLPFAKGRCALRKATTRHKLALSTERVPVEVLDSDLPAFTRKTHVETSENSKSLRCSMPVTLQSPPSPGRDPKACEGQMPVRIYLASQALTLAVFYLGGLAQRKVIRNRLLHGAILVRKVRGRG